MILCVDVGGTSTRVGVSQDGSTFLNEQKFDTPQEFLDLINLIKNSVVNHSEITNISFGVAGVVDIKSGKINWNPNRKSWSGIDAFSLLKEIFPNADSKIENDANLATLGEAVFGAGKDKNLVAFLTLSTGIGGGLVINKKIAPSVNGFEPGHQIISDSDIVWSCGQIGCFESFASGTAFQKIYGVNPAFCDDKNIWDDYSKMLARGVCNVIAIWSPEIIIFGGGVSNKFDMFEAQLTNNLKELVTFGSIPELKKAELGESGLYGGLALFLPE